MRYSYRRYQDGDAPAINELYFKVTGRLRTVEEHAWQWLTPPAGESEMWLIEAELDNKTRKLVGHHGVMAQQFSYRGALVSVGKTENTMVLPEYRDRLLYPRFERAFLNEYQHRFHALFSTIGPSPAIRLRQAMGYEASQHWVNIYVGREPFLSIDLIREQRATSPRNLRAMISPSSSVRINGGCVTCLDGQEDTFDFDAFWETASVNYGLTPARTRANLQWRFWSNPYMRHHTLRLDDDAGDTAIAIVTVRRGYVLHVHDLYCENPKRLGYFLQMLSRWSITNLGLGTIASLSTTDGIEYFSACKSHRSSWANRITRRHGALKAQFMPRKVTSMGLTHGIDTKEPWYVTPFYFEGR